MFGCYEDSMAVLLKIYAKCIDGQDHIARRRIEDTDSEPGPQSDPEGDG